MDFSDQWWRYALGGVFFIMGIYGCLFPKRRLFKIGSARPPYFARPLPRWVATLMSASVAIIGLFVAAYKIIEHRFSHAVAIRLLLVVAILGVSSYGLVHLYTGINARPKSGVESFLAETEEYRSRALINAFGSLVIVLFLVYLVIAWPS